MDEIFTDPVCGVQVTAETAAGKSEYEGHTYYFCSVVDKEIFENNPEKYVILEESDRR